MKTFIFLLSPKNEACRETRVSVIADTIKTASEELTQEEAKRVVNVYITAY